MSKKFFETAGSWFLAVVILVGIVFGTGYLSLITYRVFGTRMEDAKTDIYRKNKSYIEGTVRDLREMRREYVNAEDGHKEALKSLIIHRAGELDWNRLPSDVRGFLNELEEE